MTVSRKSTYCRFFRASYDGRGKDPPSLSELISLLNLNIIRLMAKRPCQVCRLRIRGISGHTNLRSDLTSLFRNSKSNYICRKFMRYYQLYNFIPKFSTRIKYINSAISFKPNPTSIHHHSKNELNNSLKKINSTKWNQSCVSITIHDDWW